jgi:SagB-type dehydrogenase family enzyme
MKTPLRLSLAAAVILFATVGSLSAQDLKPIQLPKPQTDIGKPLMQVLNSRQTVREFAPRALPQQELSNLIWAAWGINRTDGKRTAPSAMNNQEIDVYVVMADGTYLYDAKAHALTPVVPGDNRKLCGTQPFVATAPVNFVYIADYARMGRTSDSDKVLYSCADTGCIAQNVYLYCASQGLNVVVRAMIDRDTLGKTLKLRPDQKIILSQTVGYAK